MLEDMYKVLDRISEIQKRFNVNKNYIPYNRSNESSKNFKDALSEQINPVPGNTVKDMDSNVPASRIREIAAGYAVKNGLPPALVNAVIKVESEYNPKAVSNKGAAGLMQLMPDVLKDMGISDPFSIDENISAGVNVLKKLLEKYDWDFKKALAAYNAGEKAVDKDNAIPAINETREYVKKVIDAYIENIK